MVMVPVTAMPKAYASAAEVSEREHQRQHRHHQHPVDPRHVDLADRRRRGVRDPQPRQVAQLDGLRDHREGPGDHRLGRDHGGRRRQQHHRQPSPLGGQQEERGAVRRSSSCRSSAPWPEIAQRAGRQHQAQPADDDGPSAEMAHVGVERLGAGDRQHDRGQREERDVEVPGHERRSRTSGDSAAQNARVGDDPADTARADRDEPQRSSPARRTGRRRRCPAAARRTAPR